MNTNYNAAQPAFTARFVPSGIDLNAKKLQKIQERFSKLTEHYKTDTLTVKSSKVERDGNPDDFFYNADFYTNNAAPATFLYLDDFKAWFDRASVDEAAKTLTRIFKAGKHIEVSEPAIFGMKTQLAKLKNTAAVNRRVAEITKLPAFKTVAESNEKRVNSLTREIKAKEAHENEVQYKIQDYPIDADVTWWNDLLYY